MPDGLATLHAYVLTRWLCTYCGVYERGTDLLTQPLTTCPQCGRRAELKVTVRGMTSQRLPFHSMPRTEDPREARYADLKNIARRNLSGEETYFASRGNRANGKSTGRPRKKPLEQPNGAPA